MIRLPDANSSLTVVTSTATTTCDISAFGLSAQNAAISPAANVTGAATTTVATGAANISRVCVRNSHASLTQAVVANVVTGGVTAKISPSVTLAAGESLEYEDGQGWVVRDSTGAVRANAGSLNQKSVTYRIPANNATFTPFIHRFNKASTIAKVTYIPDGGGSSPVGTIAVNTGVAGSTVIACAAQSIAAAATGVPIDIPITTAANAICNAGDIVSLTVVNTSGTLPIATIVVDYYNT